MSSVFNKGVRLQNGNVGSAKVYDWEIASQIFKIKNTKHEDRIRWCFIYHLITVLLTPDKLVQFSKKYTSDNKGNITILQEFNIYKNISNSRIFNSRAKDVFVRRLSGVLMYFNNLHDKMKNNNFNLKTYGSSANASNNRNRTNTSKNYSFSPSDAATLVFLRWLDMTHDETIKDINFIEFMNNSNISSLSGAALGKVRPFFASERTIPDKIRKILEITKGIKIISGRSINFKATKGGYEADLRDNISYIFGLDKPSTINPNTGKFADAIDNSGFIPNKISVALDQEGEFQAISTLIAKNSPLISTRWNIPALIDPGHNMLKQVGISADAKGLLNSSINNSRTILSSTYRIQPRTVNFKIEDTPWYSLRWGYKVPQELPPTESGKIRFTDSFFMEHKIGNSTSYIDISPVSKGIAKKEINNSKRNLLINAKYYGDFAQIVEGVIAGRESYYTFKGKKCWATASGDGVFCAQFAHLATVFGKNGRKPIALMVDTPESQLGNFINFYNAGFGQKFPNLINNERKLPTSPIASNSMMTGITSSGINRGPINIAKQMRYLRNLINGNSSASTTLNLSQQNFVRKKFNALKRRRNFRNLNKKKINNTFLRSVLTNNAAKAIQVTELVSMNTQNSANSANSGNSRNSENLRNLQQEKQYFRYLLAGNGTQLKSNLGKNISTIPPNARQRAQTLYNRISANSKLNHRKYNNANLNTLNLVVNVLYNNKNQYRNLFKPNTPVPSRNTSPATSNAGNSMMSNNTNINRRGNTNAQKFANFVRNRRRMKNARITRGSTKPVETAIKLRNINPSINIVSLANKVGVNNLERIYSESRGNANSIYKRLSAYRENSATSPQSRQNGGAQRAMNTNNGGSVAQGAMNTKGRGNNGGEVSSALRPMNSRKRSRSNFTQSANYLNNNASSPLQPTNSLKNSELTNEFIRRLCNGRAACRLLNPNVKNRAKLVTARIRNALNKTYGPKINRKTPGQVMKNILGNTNNARIKSILNSAYTRGTISNDNLNYIVRRANPNKRLRTQ